MKLGYSTSNLPRNSISRNKNSHKKKDSPNEVKKKIMDFNNICNKHNIHDSTFTDPKFTGIDGTLTYLETEQKIKLSIATGIIIVSASLIIPTKNISEIEEIRQKKIEKDKKFQQEHLEKIDKIEDEDEDEDEDKNKKQNENTPCENLSNADSDINKPETIINDCDDAHLKLINDLDSISDLIENTDNMSKSDVVADKEPNIVIDKGSEIVADKESEIVTEKESDVVADKESDVVTDKGLEIVTDKGSEIVVDKGSEIVTNEESNIDNKKSNNTNKKQAKRDRSIKNIKDAANQPVDKKNKNYRNFMKDIKSKFVLKPITEYGYFIALEGTTNFIVVAPIVSEIIMPPLSKNRYFLIEGDIQSKWDVIKQIDPTYKAEKILKSRDDFLERIKAKENTIAKKSLSNVIENESTSDDLSDNDESPNIDNISQLIDSVHQMTNTVIRDQQSVTIDLQL